MILIPRIVWDKDLMISMSLLPQMIPQYKFYKFAHPKPCSPDSIQTSPKILTVSIYFKIILFPMLHLMWLLLIEPTLFACLTMLLYIHPQWFILSRLCCCSRSVSGQQSRHPVSEPKLAIHALRVTSSCIRVCHLGGKDVILNGQIIILCWGIGSTASDKSPVW